MKIRTRAALFTPATHPERFPKASEAGADLLLIDLEDSVAPADKLSARQNALAALAEPNTSLTARAVRINSIRTRAGLADLAALYESNAQPDAIVLPKTKSVDEISIVEAAFRERPGVRLIPIIESAQGLDAARGIAAASDRILALLLGAADLAGELGCTLDSANITAARVKVVEACARAGVAAMDSPYFNFRDADGLAREAEQARQMGFAGKAAIHPLQIPPVLKIFTPTPEAVKRAREILRINERGVGAIDGLMVDEAVARQARRVIAAVE
jgi:(S)-citramalyl-CoA lyase